MTSTHDIDGLLGALALINEVALDHSDQGRCAKARAAVLRSLAEARIRERPRCIAEVAHLAGVSPETMRRRLLKLFPEAKRGGRYHIDPEMIAALLA